ncbi:MAG: alpha/beta hydrolase [Pseudomonadota bacterium]
MRRPFIWIGGAILAAAICFAGLVIWSNLPVRTDRTTPDPGLLYLNNRSPEAPPLEEAYFEHKGQSLHYVEAGDGEVVLFLHGFPSYWYSFARQIDDMRADYRVIAIDGLAAGRSDAPFETEPYKLEAMSEHIHALLDDLAVEKAHLVGHDWGAALVFGFAQRYPERVATVTGISSPPQNILLQLMETNPRQQETSAYVERFKRANPILLLALRIPQRIWKEPYSRHVERGLLSEEEGNLFRDALASPKRIHAHINWYRANIPPYEDITEQDYWPGKNASIDVPALLIWGKSDNLFEPEFIDLMLASSANLEVVQFDDVGHWPHLAQAKTVTTKIREMIVGPYK